MNEELKILSMIGYAKDPSKRYAALPWVGGYQSTYLDKAYPGQRDTVKRLDQLNYAFRDAVVLDLGCNQGGMLLALRRRIRLGVGVDYNPRLINVCNRMKRYRGAQNLDFYCMDFDKEPLHIMDNFLPYDPTVCLMLSVGMWIQQWQELIVYCKETGADLIYESNGTATQQENQIAFLYEQFPTVQPISSKSQDDSYWTDRQVVVCKGVPKWSERRKPEVENNG